MKMLLMMKMVVFVMMMFVAFEEFLLGRFVVKQLYVSQICRGQFVVAKNVANTSSTSFLL